MIDPLTYYVHRMADHHGPLALMYHFIQDGHRSPSWPWATSVKQFEKHLDLLKTEGWHTRTVQELISLDPESKGQRTVAITFDDGFADNLLAFEALQRYGMRATWFVVTNVIGKMPNWADTGRPSGRMLDRGELRALAEAGMEIGSHSQSHTRLPRLPDKSVKDELTSSRAILEDILGSSVRSFAYPYGDWDLRCEAFVREAGYSAACTTRTGVAMRDNDPLRIRRLTVFNSDGEGHLARKLGLASNEGSWGAGLKYLGRRVAARARSRLG